MTIDTRRSERGYAMAALLVAMSIMAIALSTALPVFQTAARREREAELVFRGEQYARAIGLFQRKYANALPPDVQVLIDQRFLRKKYKDPITGGDFQLMGPGSPELAQALGTTPQQAADALRGRGAGGRGVGTGSANVGRIGQTQSTQFGSAQGTSQSGSAQGMSQFGSARGAAQFGSGRGAAAAPGGRGPLTAAGQAASTQAGGGILAVASKSTETSFRQYNGKSKYNEWIFMAVAATTAAGAPPGAGGPVPGGRGGRAGGRGGTTPGRGTPGPAPGGTRGRGGFTPFGVP
jgi:type II secretory pathway pseudopilin PulG